MSPSRHAPSAIHALYRVFVLPALTSATAPVTKRSTSAAQLLRLSATPYSHHPHSCGRSRTFTTTTPLCAKTRAAEIRSQKWNEEITARFIHLVDPVTNTLSPEPVTRYSVLRDLDTKTHRLVQLSPDPPPGRNYSEFTPTCKIVSKKEAYEDEKRAKDLAKAKKRALKVMGGAGLKTLELNWAIDQHDLGHRMTRFKEFLLEGRRVEIVLAAKKRGRKASREECEAVLEKVMQVVGEVEGAKQREEMQGKIGGFVTMVFQGRPVFGENKVANASTGADEEGDEDEGEIQEKKRRKRWDQNAPETLSTAVEGSGVRDGDVK